MQNSWLTPPQLRSLIALDEMAAPRGVSGYAYRGHIRQSRESAADGERRRIAPGDQ